MNKLDSLRDSFLPPEPRNRAMEIVTEAANEYKSMSERLKPDQAINLICSVGGTDYDVMSLYSPKIDVVCIHCKTNECEVFITAPVEQVCFTTIISKKVNDEPPREIGFHASMQSKKQD